MSFLSTIKKKNPSPKNPITGLPEGGMFANINKKIIAKQEKAEAASRTGFAPSEASAEELASHLKVLKKTADKEALTEKIKSGDIFGGGGSFIDKLQVKQKKSPATSALTPALSGTTPAMNLSPSLSTVVKGSPFNVKKKGQLIKPTKQY